MKKREDGVFPRGSNIPPNTLSIPMPGKTEAEIRRKIAKDIVDAYYANREITDGHGNVNEVYTAATIDAIMIVLGVKPTKKEKEMEQKK